MVDTKKTILVRLRGDLYARLEALAQKENRSIANMLDTMLSDMLAPHQRQPGDIIDTPVGPAVVDLVEDLPESAMKLRPPVFNKLPTAMPTTLAEANDPKSPGYSAEIRLDIIKTPAQAKKAVEDIAPHTNFLDRKYSRLKNKKD